MALDIWCYALDRNRVISAIHVPGKWNHIADGKSRIFHDSIEWMLDHNLFKQITKHLGLPVVDLFASQVNHQMPEFVSWRPEPGAIATDTFNIPWDFPLSYLFPPFCLIKNVPKESNAGAGRLHSHCSSMEELAMVFSTPIHAYRASSAIASGSENPEAPRDRQDSSPLLPEEIPVSCMENFRKSLQNKGFPEEVSKLYYPPGEATQPSNMKVLGKAGVAGVVKKSLILFLQL